MIFNCPFCREQVTVKSAVDCPSCSRRMIRPCPYCAEDISVLSSACKYCGENVQPAPVEPARRPAPVPQPVLETIPDVEIVEERVERPEVEFIDEAPARPVPSVTRAIPWEDPSQGGRIRRWWSTWSSSMFDMEGFWKREPVKGQFAAINYSWFLTVQLLALFGVPFLALFHVAALAEGEPLTTHLGACALFGALFPITWLFTAVTTWVGAALWHLPLKLLGAKGGYGVTVRAMAYGAGSGVWCAVPFIGPFVAYFLSTSFNYHAFKQAHKMSSGRAFIGAILPTIVAVGAIIGLLALAVAVGGCPSHAPVRTVYPPC